MIDKYWQDPGTVSVGELKSRAYFIPFTDETSCFNERECSPNFTLLNGNWHFLYEDNVRKIPQFWETAYDDTVLVTVPVPSCWQTTGFDRAQYQTSPYPFLFDPPSVPEKNPAGAYRRVFSFSPRCRKTYELHLEGEDSSAYVWLNGQFVGYTEACHNDAAFDVTGKLLEGDNILAVLVLKYCTTSYLDDQDKIRLSGLFRDIYILERTENGLEDFFLHTANDGRIWIDINAKSPVHGKILLPDGSTVSAGDSSGGILSLQVPTPHLWSAEDPYLYNLVLSCAGEWIGHKLGFREICSRGPAFTINGKHVKLHGVNRHDSDPVTGYTVTVQSIRRDLYMMKQANMNCLRTSHYPNDPRLYRLCDELGIYVISEADIENHGCAYTGNWQAVNASPNFREAYLDRMTRMVETLKNFTSIIWWSLGNESLWHETTSGSNHRYIAEYTAERDPSRPIHYESIRHNRELLLSGDSPVNLLGCCSTMYPKFSDMDELLCDPCWQNKPVFLCEYTHAMGNSCGDAEAYQEKFYSDQRFIGGCVWEWCDHAILDEASSRMLYGGDFGEQHHARNVCMDGLVSPFREPHSAYYEIKQVFLPVVFRMENGKFFIENRNRFVSLEKYEIKYQLERNGTPIFSRILALDTPPESTEELQLKLPEEELYENSAIRFSVCLKEACAWAPKGFELGFRQFRLTKQPVSLPGEASESPVLKMGELIWTVSGNGFSYAFDACTGIIISARRHGIELLKKPPELCCWRAPLDNDIGVGQNGISLQWNMTGSFGRIAYPEQCLKNLQASQNNEYVKISGDLIFAVQGRKHILKGNMSYLIYGDGRLEISHTGRINPELPYWLPRYGFLWTFDESIQYVEYLGMGPGENYPDKYRAAWFGHFKYDAQHIYETYEKPQESGERCGVRWMTLTDRDGHGVRFSGDFTFRALPYDDRALAEAGHISQLKHTGCIYLHTDLVVSGVGSASCGGNSPSENARINPGQQLDSKLTVQLL